MLYFRLNYVKIGNHYEVVEDSEHPRSKQYYFPVQDKNGDPVPEFLLSLECFDGEWLFKEIHESR